MSCALNDFSSSNWVVYCYKLSLVILYVFDESDDKLIKKINCSLRVTTCHSMQF
jgi:hypothetical protein